jgi:hypothetical protein
MRLARVEYEFFDFEQPSDSARELARQVRLQFADAPTLFLSWTWERQHDSNSQPYSIGCSANSFFQDNPPPSLTRRCRHYGQDMSAVMWK